MSRATHGDALGGGARSVLSQSHRSVLRVDGATGAYAVIRRECLVKAMGGGAETERLGQNLPKLRRTLNKLKYAGPKLEMPLPKLKYTTPKLFLALPKLKYTASKLVLPLRKLK